MFFPLEAVAKNYDWGTPGAMSGFVSGVRTKLPEAELWFGAHPSSQCTVLTDHGEEDFPSWLNNEALNFSLLVKLLAASQPLSIQVHPDSHQARKGFEQEDSLGIDPADPERTYKDTSPKPELIVALSDDFYALWGFVPAPLVEARLSDLEASGFSANAVEILRDRASESIEHFVRWVLSGDESLSVAVSALESWARTPRGTSGMVSGLMNQGLVGKLAGAHPGDPGILFSLLMHYVELKRGEALFVRPGEVHAYVEGFGLEVMLPSDNVVRAGLTSKHKDSSAFLELANMSSAELPPMVAPLKRGNTSTYANFGAPWEVIGVHDQAEVGLEETSTIVIVESGSATLSAKGAQWALDRGNVGFWARESGVLHTTAGSRVWLIRPV
jgi:mannose-6-phosphate isomerase